MSKLDDVRPLVDDLRLRVEQPHAYGPAGPNTLSRAVVALFDALVELDKDAIKMSTPVALLDFPIEEEE